MNLIFLAFAVCVLWGVNVQRKGFDERYLSIEKGRSFRGLLALTVVCHHLAEKTGDSSLFHIFAFLGFLPVAYFFFLSGYGLQKSYASKSGYRASILRKRIPSVLVPYLAVTGLYWLLSWMEGNPYTVAQVLRSFVNGDPIARFTWYIVFVLLLYAGFYLVSALYRGNQLRGVVWNLLLVLGFTALFRSLGYSMFWYNSCMTFPLGVLWAMKEETFLPFVRKHFWGLTGLLVPAFGAVFLAALLLADASWVLPLYWLSGILFTAVCLLLQMKVTFGNRLLKTLGDCSMEIYMLQGFFLTLYRGKRVYMENPALWSAAVLVSTCLAAWGMHWLFGRKKKKIRV